MLVKIRHGDTLPVVDKINLNERMPAAKKIVAKFPPIKIQGVFNYKKENEKIEATLILDGKGSWIIYRN